MSYQGQMRRNKFSVYFKCFCGGMPLTDRHKYFIFTNKFHKYENPNYNKQISIDAKKLQVPEDTSALMMQHEVHFQKLENPCR